MKFTLFILILLAHCNSFSQQTSFKNAVCIECASSRYPVKCTEQKIENDIVGLLNESMISDLPEKNKNNYFSISIFLALDANGNVIQDLNETRSDSENLKNAAFTYLNNLSGFISKDANIKEKRSVYVINRTFIYEANTHNYRFANAAELKQKKIKPDYINYDQAALYKSDCADGTYDEQLKCTTNSIFKYIAKNYKTPEIKRQAPIGVHLILLIDSDGKVSVEIITGSSPNVYEKEAI